MANAAAAISYALFVWWFSTGLVLLMVLRKRRALQASLIGAALLFPVCLVVLAKSSGQANVAGVYTAFTAAIVLWGTQEVFFLTGFLTGPRPLPCPDDAKGFARVRYALGAILYHELALLGSGLAVLAATSGGVNPFGWLTFLVLYALRISAKLNLFLGVPVLNDSFLPESIAFVRSYFRRAPVNGFFPVSVLLAVIAACGFAAGAVDAEATSAIVAGYTLVCALLALAILEHLFMLVQLPLDRFWAWSTRGRADRQNIRRQGFRRQDDVPRTHESRTHDMIAGDAEHAIRVRG